MIFVDLSLAQIASLGAAIAVWQGYDAHDPAIYWMSLGFTLIGALIFAMVKGQEAKIPQEAIIGISYAVASAAVILTMSKATGEAEHLKDMLVGNILSVQWPEVWLTAAIYARDRPLPLHLQEAVPGDLARPERGRRQGHVGAVLGLPLLRVVRPGRHALGRDRGRAARLLLSHRAVGRRHAVRRAHRSAGWRSAG